MRKLVLLVLLTTAALLAGACTFVISGDGHTFEHCKGTWEETYTFSGGAQLSLRTNNASIFLLTQ